MDINNACVLITYPDSLGQNLGDLCNVLDTHFTGVFGGVHVLPFFPSSADRGFAPITYERVDPAFGTWDDISTLAARYNLVVDFMINHISRRSEYVQEFLERRDESEYASMFIRAGDVWGDGTPKPGDLRHVYTRKPRQPLTEVTFADGTTELLWCTFDEEQIDLDVSSRKTRTFIRESLAMLTDRGARIIRLDAFAYTTKRLGTDCFFVEPDVWEVLDLARSVCEPRGVLLLPEVHEHYSYQMKLAEHGYWVYDFALPMLVLQAIYDGESGYLADWLRRCPRHQFTTLDTHDGIGVVDVQGLLPQEVIDRTKDNLYERGANVKPIYSSAAYDNLDVYQINCTYYSALGDDDERYLLARAIQVFAPGIPQIYYVGLLAGSNDLELLEATGVGRNINRHYYTKSEVEREASRPVVGRLLGLLRLRNTHPAFGGSCTVEEPSPSTLSMTRRLGPHRATLNVDFATAAYSIDCTPAD